MNWFHFLKNKKGKLVLSVQNALIVSAGIGILGTTLMQNVATTQVQNEMAARSIASISSGYNYGGMRQAGRDGLTSINVKDGLNQVATAEERARLEQGRTGGGDFGLSAADNLGGSVSSSLTGRAAETTATEGLGMGRNAVVMQEGSGNGNGNAGGARVNPGALGRRGTTGRTNSSNTLTPVAPNRSGGNGINASYGGVSNGGDQTGNVAGAPGTRKGEGYNFSGSMPGGTDPLSMRQINGQNSTFMAGGRHATVGRGRQTGRTGNDLKDISKRSAEVARNANRASNEGSTAFLAGGRNSGGMDINSGVETTQTGSADLAPAEARHIKAIGGWGDKTSDQSERQGKARDKLRNWLLGLIGATVVGLVIAAGLLSSGGWWKYLGYIPLLGILYMIYRVVKEAETYRATWNANAFPNICEVLCAVALAGVAITAINPQAVWNWIGKVWKRALKSAVTTIGLPMAQTVVQDAVNSDK